MPRIAAHDARVLGPALIRLLALAAVAASGGGCCAWPFEDAESGAASSRVVAMPLAVARAAPRPDQPLAPSICQALCAQDDCFPSAVTGSSGVESAVVVCNSYSPRHCSDSGFLSFRMPSGRRSAWLGGSPGAALVALAAAEGASVLDFQRLAGELHGWGAPAQLVARTRRARMDEVRHEVVLGALARRVAGVTPSERAGDRVQAAPARSRRAAARSRSLRSLAVDNVVRGCVGETWGALLLAFGARRAEDPAVRSALGRVARDEIRHAALAFAIHRWVAPLLGAEGRRAVRVALERATARLVEVRPRLDPAVQRALGHPSAAEHAALASATASLVRDALGGLSPRSSPPVARP